jgi:hypothetical protein
VKIFVNIAVPETQYSESAICKIDIAFFITFRVRNKIVLAAVDLDNETMLQAHEIHDVASARGLAAEMKSTLSP